MKREEIIKYLNKTPTADDFYYDQLKDCIKMKWRYDTFDGVLSCKDIDEHSNCRIDEWFSGIIKSLYYKPNHTVLVLLSEKPVGKTEFFRRLLPQKDWYCEGNDKTQIFEKLICNFDEGFDKNKLDYAEKDDFQVRYPYTEQMTCDKRLYSYCSATNYWHHPPRKNFIVLPVVEIDWELFNSIDKHLLWIEIFNKFKPNDRVNAR